MAELRKDSLSFLEALGQSVANLSPTFTPAVAVTVVAAAAGTASWLVYVLATISLVIVGINIGKLASKISAAGSFFIYVSRTLGPFWGMLCGWAMTTPTAHANPRISLRRTFSATRSSMSAPTAKR